MKGSEERTLTIPLLPEDSIGFKIFKDGEPVEGARVTLCTKDLLPATFSKTTDSNGRVIFHSTEITPPEIHLPCEFLKNVSWLIFANVPESEYSVWKDNVTIECGKLYTYKLKKYTKPPTFFLKLEIRDIIGAELFSNLVAEVQKTALDWAGMEVTKVEGQGTRFITIHFRPPFHESPIIVEWAAVWFILKVIAVAGAIIAILVVLKWYFGELAPAVGIGIIVILALAAAAAGAKPAKKVVKRIRERVKR